MGADGAETAVRQVDFTMWREHFASNPQRQQPWDEAIDWSADCLLTPPDRSAFVRSLQRFELGEDGDGAHLLAKAERAGDSVYTAALRLLVAEEQRHSALFGRAIDHLGGTHLSSHWSDSVFTLLRRALGLRTEIGLFLVAEAVAMGYFEALAQTAPDPVLRGIGARIAHDERDHLRFQIDRLRAGFAEEKAWRRGVARVGLTVVAIGATAVLVIGHRAALRACGHSPLRYGSRAVARFRECLRQVMHRSESSLGPSPAFDTVSRSAVKS